MTDTEFALSEYDPEEADAILDELVESDGEDFSERRRRRPRARTPQQRPTPGADMQRTGQGIKAINDRITALDSKVDKAVAVLARDRAAIARMEKLGKIDGALDLAASFNGSSLDVFQVVKGSLKMGLFGEPKGVLGNPAVIGGVGLLLKNPGILGQVLGPK